MAYPDRPIALAYEPQKVSGSVIQATVQVICDFRKEFGLSAHDLPICDIQDRECPLENFTESESSHPLQPRHRSVAYFLTKATHRIPDGPIAGVNPFLLSRELKLESYRKRVNHFDLFLMHDQLVIPGSTGEVTYRPFAWAEQGVGVILSTYALLEQRQMNLHDAIPVLNSLALHNLGHMLGLEHRNGGVTLLGEHLTHCQNTDCIMQNFALDVASWRDAAKTHLSRKKRGISAFCRACVSELKMILDQ